MTSDASQPSAARPVLQRWLTDASHTHPVRVMEVAAGTNLAVLVGLDALETMAAALDATATGDPRWRRKIAEFGQLTSMGQLLEMRAEFALALADAGIGYRSVTPRCSALQSLITPARRAGSAPATSPTRPCSV
ncbi:hypothetical protein ACIPSA_41745 [Streptomyces sp. NPDC086549]|uniref:hypothetical protein n=1 Tax=Streptomyces sp. NPDC086549 TaxID=3365752 RepID=UPI0037F1892D